MLFIKTRVCAGVLHRDVLRLAAWIAARDNLHVCVVGQRVKSDSRLNLVLQIGMIVVFLLVNVAGVGLLDRPRGSLGALSGDLSGLESVSAVGLSRRVRVSDVVVHLLEAI